MGRNVKEKKGEKEERKSKKIKKRQWVDEEKGERGEGTE